MVWKEVVETLRKEGFNVTEAQIRWAITSGKIERPTLDASLRFEFDARHLDQLRQVLAEKRLARESSGGECGQSACVNSMNQRNVAAGA